MIGPPHLDGVVFSQAAEGDLRHDEAARAELSRSLGISPNWAWVRQVHQSEVLRVTTPGLAGEADALWTEIPGLPIAVFTADCFGVVLRSGAAVGIAHAGWRGAMRGVVTALREEMTKAGHGPHAAAVGPGIGPCCFEVGSEVSSNFPDSVSSTRWQTTSVDLPDSIRRELEGLETWMSTDCTVHDPGWYSHRALGSQERMATLAWIP